MALRRSAESHSGTRIRAERRRYRGAPTVFVNGQPVHVGAVMFRNVPGQGTRFAREIPSLSAARPTVVMAFSSFQVGPDSDFLSIERWYDKTFSQHPEALGACHVGLEPSMEWALSHPKEMTVYDRPVDWAKVRQRDASWASEVWRVDSARLVQELARHLHSAFSGRVILYQVGSGSCHENFPLVNPYFGSYVGGWFCGDFSEPMLRHLRRKLREYYRGDVDRLRKAWGDPKVTFESAMPPARAERMRSEWFSFRSPCRSQTADYYRAWSQAVEDCVLIWARAAKRGTDNAALTASPIGSILDCGLNANLVHHLMKNTFARALSSADLDMLQSPASYVLRDLGRGDTSSMIPLGSVRLAGKLWLRDLDSRTSLVAEKSDDSPVGSLWRSPRTVWEDQQLLKRDTGYSLIKGGAYWWHEIEPRMYSLPEHLRVVRRLEAIARGTIHADRSTAPGLGVFVDHESNFHQANSNRLIYAMNYEARRLHWTHAGMACETYNLNDAADPRMPPHKVLMVTNAFRITESQVRALRALARRNEATLIWLVAPGIQANNRFDLRRASRITGFHLRAADVEALPQVSLVPARHPWSQPRTMDGRTLTRFGGGLHEDDDSGARAVGPLFYVDRYNENDTTILGTLDVLAKPGLAVRRMDGYVTVYCAAPYVHNALLRAIAKDTGAHLYLDTDDLVHAAADLLLVNARRSGRKMIRWPRRAGVVLDLWTGRKVARAASHWSVTMRQHETRLYFAGSARAAQRIRDGMKCQCGA